MNRSAIAKMLVILLAAIACIAQAQDAPAPQDTSPKTEKVTYLGITTTAVDATLRDQLNLPDGVGLTVMTVDSKGPAAADLHADDVLQKLDDQLLIDPHQLVTLIHLHHLGDSVTLTIIRQAKPATVTIKLGEKERVIPPKDAAMPPNNLPELKILQDMTAPIPFDTQLPLGPSQTTLSYKDDVYSAYINTDKDGHHQLTVNDPAGKTLAQGPVDTPEDWQKFSPDIRAHLEVMHKMLGQQQK